MKKIFALFTAFLLLFTACSPKEYTKREEYEDGDGYVITTYHDPQMEQNPVSLDFYDAEGSLSMHVAYEYDNNGRRVRTTQSDSEGNVEQVVTNEYDKNGNLVRVVMTDGDGNKTTVLENDYTADGVITESRNLHKGVLVSITQYESDGITATRTDFNTDGTVMRYTTFEYDENGFQLTKFYTPDMVLTQSVQYTPEGPIVKNYDENGNETE